MVLSHTATQATGTLQFASEATGTLGLAGQTIDLTAKNGGNAAAAEGNAVANLAITFGAGSAGTSYDASTHTLSVSVTAASATATVADVISAIAGGSDFGATLHSGGVGSTTVATGDDASATFALTGGQDAINLTALSGGNAAGVEGNAVANLALTFGAGSAATSYDASTHTLSVSVTQASGTATEQNILDAINGGTDFTATAGANASATGDDATAVAALTGGRAAGAGTITVTSDTTGANTHTVTLTEDNTITTGTAVAAIDGSGNIGVKVRGTVAYSAIKTAIDGLAGYHATLGTNSGDQNYVQSLDTPPSATTLAGGVAASGGLDSGLVFEISGSTGADVLSFGAGTGISTIVDAVNAGSDSTGVTAADNAGTLELTSTAYGSNAFVSVKVLSGDDNGTFAGGLQVGGVAGTRATGTDINASVNGIQASGDGNKLSINTASLDLSLTVNAGSSTAVNFTINGGGALFQLGPEVVSNQQARIGITSVNTAKLGGTDGKLFQLGSGGIASLSTDPTKAASIVDEAINQITSLRGRLGAFQRTSLETNKNALNDTLVNLTDAQSNIADADFASETANLTRAQILVQSGTTVLQIANQNPQNVLALLKGA